MDLAALEALPPKQQEAAYLNLTQLMISMLPPDNPGRRAAAQLAHERYGVVLDYRADVCPDEQHTIRLGRLMQRFGPDNHCHESFRTQLAELIA